MEEEVIDVEELEEEKARTLFTFAKEMFPDVDANYLHNKCLQFAFDQNEFNNFIADTMLNHNYPKEQQATTSAMTKDENNRWKNFEIPAYIEKFPDPKGFFMNSNNGLRYTSHSISFLQERFKFRSTNTIKHILKKHDFNLYKAWRELKRLPRSRKNPRLGHEIDPGIGAPPSEFFDEVTFITNEDSIQKYQKEKSLLREAAKEAARQSGKLITCCCCFTDDLLPEDVISCPEGHLFCKQCVKRSTEVLMGDGKIDFPCLQPCGASFKVDTLKDVMQQVSYEKLLKLLQGREVEQAAIPGLESCPFCDFYAIPEDTSRTFDCLNCKKSSCRLCRKDSHIPYSCAEVSKATKDRTYVEERMTKALIRDCYKCGSKFIREDGCNKMTCHCGAQMCYLCRQPVKGYSHFSDTNRGEDGKCPLWTNNDYLHKTEVNREAKRAIAEVNKENNDVDPETFKKLC